MCVMKCIPLPMKIVGRWNFEKLWKRWNNALQWKKFIFKQLIGENKQLIDEKDVCVQTGKCLKPTSQLNINRAAAARFLPDAYFVRSVARRPILLTLNNVVKSASGRMTAATGRLFGHRPILSANYKIFSRCPAGVPATIVRRPSGDRRRSSRSPPDDNESCDHRPSTFWWLCGHCRELHCFAFGFNFEIDFWFSHVYNNC